VEQYLMITRSLTYAQRMEKTLSRAGIRTRIFRAPKELTDRGCAYAVQVSHANLNTVLTMLNGAGLGPLKIYLIRSGSYIELSNR